MRRPSLVESGISQELKKNTREEWVVLEAGETDEELGCYSECNKTLWTVYEQISYLIGDQL